MKKHEFKHKVANTSIEEELFEIFFELELESYIMSEMQYQVELDKNPIRARKHWKEKTESVKENWN